MNIFQRNHILFAVAVGFCGLLLGIFLFTSTDTLSEKQNVIQHTNTVILSTEKLSTSIERILSSQRGLIISKEQSFRDEYEDKKNESNVLLAQLFQLTADNPLQQSRLRDIQEKLQRFKDLLEFRANTFMNGTNVVAFSNSDLKLVMQLKDSISDSILGMTNEEYRLLQLRFMQLQQSRQMYITSLIVVFGVSLMLLYLLNSYLLKTQSLKGTAERRLEETQERLRLALQGTEDGVYDWDIRNDAVYWSPQCCAMLGYTPDTIKIARFDDIRPYVHPDDIAETEEKLKAYLDKEIPEFSHDLRMLHRHGPWIWIRSRGKGTFDENGTATRLTGTHMDITAIKEQEARLAQQKEQAEAANHAKTEFLAHMSHELRTPITAIIGVAELLDGRKDKLEPKIAKLVGTLSHSATSLRDLIDDVLDFAKIESGAITFTSAPYKPTDIFAQTISIMSARAQDAGLSFRFTWPAEMDGNTMVSGDPIRLRQILLNLIGNAIKFTPTGSVVCEAKIVDGDRMVITVTDTGIGIDTDKLELIFDRFQQGEASISRRFGGTGLGLTISRQLARLMGGDITATSVKGSGTTFTLALPYQICAVSNVASEPDRTVSGTRIPANQKVLVVEDYEGNIDMLTAMLEEMGYTCDVARNGLEAVNVLAAGKTYAFVLMDIQMPHMDGYTATRTIRSQEMERNARPVQIIGMTAHAMASDKDQCFASGMNGYVQKPMSMADLEKEIMRIGDVRKSA